MLRAHCLRRATRFVLANPAQIRKKVRSTRRETSPCVHVGLSGVQDLSLLGEALDRIAEDAAMHEEASSVLLLGRYRHIRPGNLSGLARQHPSLRLSFMTVHGSRGLQADYVVVLGLCTGRHGFPTEIAGDPLLDLALSAPERHPNAEERRLFYVALIRARCRVFVLADGGPPSPFVLELINGNYDIAVFGRMPEKETPCPRCVTGHLIRRENKRKKETFYGCSNWPYCEHRQPPCPVCGRGLPVRAEGGFRCRDCGQLIEACPSCGGWLQARMGRFGRFLGCSNYPTCDYTRDIERRQRSRGKSLTLRLGAERPLAQAGRFGAPAFRRRAGRSGRRPLLSRAAGRPDAAAATHTGYRDEEDRGRRAGLHEILAGTAFPGALDQSSRAAQRGDHAPSQSGGDRPERGKCPAAGGRGSGRTDRRVIPAVGQVPEPRYPANQRCNWVLRVAIGGDSSSPAHLCGHEAQSPTLTTSADRTPDPRSCRPCALQRQSGPRRSGLHAKWLVRAVARTDAGVGRLCLGERTQRMRPSGEGSGHRMRARLMPRTLACWTEDRLGGLAEGGKEAALVVRT